MIVPTHFVEAVQNLLTPIPISKAHVDISGDPEPGEETLLLFVSEPWMQ